MNSRISFRRMFSTPVRGVLLLLLFLPGVSLVAQNGGGGREQVIAWEPVEGASYYRLELYAGEVLIDDTETSQTRYVTFLNPGEYRYRITVFNKFKKSVSESGWLTLRVIEALQPVVRLVEPDFLYSNNGGRGEFLMEILNLEEGAEILLRTENTILKGTRMSRGENLYAVIFTDPRLGKPGPFTLEVINPSGLRDLNPDRIQIREIDQPEIDTLLPSLVGSGEILVRVPLNGWGFTPETVVTFSGAVMFQPTIVTFESSERLLLNLDLRDIPPGLYTITVENPSGLRSEKWGAFTVVDPEAVDLDGIVVDPRTGKTRKLRRFENKMAGISAGYHYSLMAGSMDKFFNTAPLGFDFRFRIPFRNDFFQKTPILRRLGLDFGVSWSMFNISEYGDYIFHVGGIDACLFYKTPFPFFLNLVIKAGAGITYSRLQGDGLLGIFDSSTLDFQVLGGAGVEISLGSFAWIELGAMARIQILLSGNNVFLQPYVMIGKYF